MSPYHDLATQSFTQAALGDRSTQPVVLTQVEVNGGDSFSREFFRKLLAPLVCHSDYTLAQLVRRTEASVDNLHKTEVFRRIAPSVHVDYTRGVPPAASYNKEQAVPTRVVFDLDADQLTAADAVLGFSTHDNLAVALGYAHRNFNHNAEQFRVAVDYRPYKPAEQLVSTMRLVLSLRNPAYKFVADLSSAYHHQPWQHNLAKATGGTLGVAWAGRAVLVFSGVELARRSVLNAPGGTAGATSGATAGGGFLKSAVVHRVAYANVRHLGNAAFPRSGVTAALACLVCSDQEQAPTSEKLALFAKAAARASVYHSFAGNAVTAHVFGEAGAIVAAKANSLAVHLSDRFYLGGPGSLRGFARNSVTPAGGLQFYKAGVTLYSRVPSLVRRVDEENPLRLYATSVVGSVGDNVVADRGVSSVGVGLRYFNEWVKLDAGYFVALRHDSSANGIRDGFQLELSLGGSTSSA